MATRYGSQVLRREVIAIFRFWITLPKDFKSDELWNNVCSYKVNVLDMGDGKIHCYGDVSSTAFGNIVSICLKFNKHFYVEVTAH